MTNGSTLDAKDGIALYQQRHTVCTKFGNSPAKDYFLVRRTGRKVSVEQLDAKAKARVVKLAKASSTLGEVINTLTGKAKRPLKAKAPANALDDLTAVSAPLQESAVVGVGATSEFALGYPFLVIQHFNLMR